MYKHVSDVGRILEHDKLMIINVHLLAQVPEGPRKGCLGQTHSGRAMAMGPEAGTSGNYRLRTAKQIIVRLGHPHKHTHTHMNEDNRMTQRQMLPIHTNTTFEFQRVSNSYEGFHAFVLVENFSLEQQPSLHRQAIARLVKSPLHERNLRLCPALLRAIVI